MSRFRPGPRKGHDNSPGEGYDGDAYEGDPYEGEPYPAEPNRGTYPAQSASHPAADRYAGDGGAPGRGSARSERPRSSGRPHPPRFRKDEVLQPTSVISPRGLVGGPRPDPGTQEPYAGGPDGGPAAYGPASYGAGPYEPSPHDAGSYDAGSY